MHIPGALLKQIVIKDFHSKSKVTNNRCSDVVPKAGKGVL
jgi:hypothetical protein